MSTTAQNLGLKGLLNCMPKNPEMANNMAIQIFICFSYPVSLLKRFDFSPSPLKETTLTLMYSEFCRLNQEYFMTLKDVSFISKSLFINRFEEWLEVFQAFPSSKDLLYISMETGVEVKVLFDALFEAVIEVGDENVVDNYLKGYSSLLCAQRVDNLLGLISKNSVNQ